MKRSLLVAALSTLAAGSAFAQSSVTAWGRLNTSVELMDDSSLSDTIWQVRNNGSRLGFRGVEDLGGGLKAGFALEHRFNSDNGAATNAAFWGGAGEASLHLASAAFGMIKAGYYTSESYFATSDATDLINHGTGTSADALYKDIAYYGNKVSYRTPEIAGGWAEGAVILGEGNNNLGRAYDLAANWASGNFGVGFGYQKAPSPLAPSFDDDQYAIRGSYSTPLFTVTGYYQRFNSDGGDSGKNIYRLSGQYNIGALELHAAGGFADELNGNGVLFDEAEQKQLTFGANYNLSKRTKVYTYYTMLEAEGLNGSSSQDVSFLAFGLRHNF